MSANRNVYLDQETGDIKILDASLSLTQCEYMLTKKVRHVLIATAENEEQALRFIELMKKARAA